MESNTIKVLGFAGSLREKSYNRALLKAAEELMPHNGALQIVDLAPLPFFNQDVEEAGIPDSVRQWADQVRAADALLMATPEYNYSIPPVLKNALDWASRSSVGAVLAGKPAAIMSASTGMFGGARAQYHLRQVCVVLNILPLNKPELMVMNADTKFDGEGRLTDEFSRNTLKKLLESLIEWTVQLRGGF